MLSIRCNALRLLHPTKPLRGPTNPSSGFGSVFRCVRSNCRLYAHFASLAHHAHAVADLERVRLAGLHHVSAFAFLAIQLDPDFQAGFGGDIGLLAERTAEHGAEYRADRRAAPIAGTGSADLAEDAAEGGAAGSAGIQLNRGDAFDHAQLDDGDIGVATGTADAALAITGAAGQQQGDAKQHIKPLASLQVRIYSHGQPCE